MYLAWVKHVETGAKRRELCTCLARPQELPLLEVGQTFDEMVDQRPFVSDLEHFLWYRGINSSDPPVDDGVYTEQIADMVRAYQAAEPMFVDGRVTPPVWEHIKVDYCEDD